MKLAKHIMVARAEGPEAGMDAYLATPIAKTHPQYAEITRKRTRKSRVSAYCKLFAGPLAVPEAHIGRKVGRPRTKAVEGQSVKAGDVIGFVGATGDALFAQFQEFLNAQGISTEVEDDDEDAVEIVENTPARKTTTVGSKRVNMPATCITAGDAWEALNTDGEFPAPRDPGKPATNGQLYRLNVGGFLNIGR